jgi:hypothetical protein
VIANQSADVTTMKTFTSGPSVTSIRMALQVSIDYFETGAAWMTCEPRLVP